MCIDAAPPNALVIVQGATTIARTHARTHAHTLSRLYNIYKKARYSFRSSKAASSATELPCMDPAVSLNDVSCEGGAAATTTFWSPVLPDADVFFAPLVITNM